MGWRTLEWNKVTVQAAGPTLRGRSTDALRPRGATSGVGITRRVKQGASVSSVNGVGAKNPRPADRRAVQPSERRSAESRGLRKAPYRLWKSARALAERESQGAISTSSCRKTAGVVEREGKQGTDRGEETLRPQ